MSVAIAIGALIASLAPITAMWITLKHSTNTDYEASQAQRIQQLERDLVTVRERNDELADENLRLMRRLLSNGSK